MEQLNNPTIKFYSVEEFQEKWEEMISRVENGEHIGIENENGNKAVMIPADDELIRIHTELNNDAQ
jgi:PHD/YefM family antitoxin component YafN of YafNO toxin-antitoxin module